MDYPQIADDLDNIMRTESGRRFIFNLLEHIGTDSCNFFADANTNAYWQGRRSVGSELLQSIRNLNTGLEYEHAMRKEARAQPQSGNSKQADIWENTY